MIKIKIKKNDIDTVAKLVIFDNKDRVLLLKRSDYHKKFAGEWDLPGGHLQEGENLIDGLKREVFEETRLKVENPTWFKKIENLNFFYSSYNSQKIVTSHEHVDYKFFEKSSLDENEKFQRVALRALEVKDEHFNNQKRNQ